MLDESSGLVIPMITQRYIRPAFESYKHILDENTPAHSPSR